MMDTYTDQFIYRKQEIKYKAIPLNLKRNRSSMISMGDHSHNNRDRNSVFNKRNKRGGKGGKGGSQDVSFKGRK
jgi:hypothetical protein